MTMTVQEIARSYRESADKGAQIGILAELNDCPKEQIIVVLKGQGITDIPAPRAKVGRKPGQKNSIKTSESVELKEKPKDSQVNALILEGIAAIDKEIAPLQEKIDLYKKKRDLLTQALELEEEYE